MAKKGEGESGGQMSLAMPASTYALNSEIAEVVANVVRDFPEKFAHLVNARIACLKRQSPRSEDDFGVDRSGGSFVRSDRERGIDARFDCGVWFRGRWWDQMTIEARRAWVFHQLCHLAPRPAGEGLKRIGHDVEAFADEGLHFGEWMHQLELFGDNVRKNRDAGGGMQLPKRGPKAVPSDPPTPFPN